ncbi:conserved hypothetical protein [uncultured delta proteobacterium]|uniref:Peptidase C39-like domain-containing protein n=1 Tax=uncultured delta proteobacterium TaxID=34034 RepID=A0A212K024_9DELT|nr:conserved hypothetical protein [uncultured delta proteobacterium]
MQRFYQGQLDFFCAAYAVVNALTALYGINLSQARVLLATALADVSRHPELWRATLYNDTDFHWLSDYMLLACGKAASYPVRVFRPFAETREIPESAADLATAKPYRDPYAMTPDSDVIWSALEEWLPATHTQPRAGSARRAVILRFHRYIRYVPNPIVSHWSVTDCHHAGVFQLRDASKEENALYSLDREVTVFAPELVSEKHPVRIEPESLYFLERR